MIGSAAVALHGADPGHVGDVDVLIDSADAATLLPRLGLPVQAGSPSALFRSTAFARWLVPPVPVEFMAGLELLEGAAWMPIRPRTRLAIGGVFTPDRDELAAILRRFGRGKDLRRAALLG